jgi:hypothetical protein
MTGNPMNDSADTMTAAVAASRAGDLDRLRTLVDWPLTGAGQVAVSLGGVLEPDRAGIAESGLAELDQAADDPEMVEEILAPLAARLASARQIAPAAPQSVTVAVDALRVPPLPPGLTGAQQDRLTALGERIDRIRAGYLVMDGAGNVMPLCVAPDTGLLVLVLD